MGCGKAAEPFEGFPAVGGSGVRPDFPLTRRPFLQLTAVTAALAAGGSYLRPALAQTRLLQADSGVRAVLWTLSGSDFTLADGGAALVSSARAVPFAFNAVGIGWSGSESTASQFSLR